MKLHFTLDWLKRKIAADAEEPCGIMAINPDYTKANETTHSGGKPHQVGYKGQRYEVSIFDEAENGRRVVGWTNDAEKASQMATGAELRPNWSAAWVTDLYTDISHTKAVKWLGERPLPSADETKGEK